MKEKKFKGLFVTAETHAELKRLSEKTGKSMYRLVDDFVRIGSGALKSMGQI